jgi:CelD/BcsL family acetyltransferase involved in cellulose biosynthesis
VANYTGFDPFFLPQYSLGTLLLMRVFEDLCANQIRKLDFGTGEHEYKRRFANCQWRESLVHIYAPGLKGMRLKALRLFIRSIHVLMEPALRRTGLFAPLMRYWHTRAVRRDAVMQGSTEMR